jgi:hypothetical protein
MLHRILGSDDAHWKPAPGAKDDAPQKSDGKHVFAASVLLDAGYTQNGARKHMLVLASAPIKDPDTCHACGQLLSVYVFRQTATGWQPELSQPYASESGQWGKPPDGAALLQLGPDRYEFSLEESGMAQGMIGDSLELFAPLEGKFASVLNFLTLDKIPLDPDETRYTEAKTTYVLGPGVTADLYDIHLFTSGNTRTDAGHVISARKDQTCSFDGTEYQCKRVKALHRTP